MKKTDDPIVVLGYARTPVGAFGKSLAGVPAHVLAALLENGWDEETATVAVPECLRPWMDGKERIGGRRRGTRAAAKKAGEHQGE